MAGLRGCFLSENAEPREEICHRFSLLLKELAQNR
jgi:hypothetical protein